MHSCAWGSLFCLLPVTMIAACGASVASPGGASVPTPRPRPTATLAPAAPAADPARAFVAHSQASFAALPGYQTQLKFYQKQGSKEAKGTYDVGGKGKQLRIFILDGNSKGTHLLWSGGKTVKVRPAGLLSALVLDLGLDDQRVTSIRGYRIDQTEMGGFLRMLADPANHVVGFKHDPGSYSMVVQGPHLLSGCSSMGVVFDEKTYLPQVIELRDAHEPVFRLDFIGLKVTPNVSVDI